uniref:Transcription factor 24-like isoform X2 n=1 Tax=Dermatophagoides pteronyssinus TaxID=6956 RepID=A0A6P6XVR5_DERPT|nr:transcription factor 24-like isoform X2 [Dermatophagoides pteronyssinus]
MARFNNHNNNRLPIPAKNAERERSRVRCLRNAFQTLQQCLPSVPPNTKLSKLDILILATNYIQILMQTLNNNNHHHHYDSENNATLSSSSTLTEEMATTTFYTIENSSNQSLSKVYRPIKKWPMRSRLYSTMMMIDTFERSKNDETIFEDTMIIDQNIQSI